MRDFDKEFRETGYLSEACRDLIPNIRELSGACFNLTDSTNRVIQEIAIRGVEAVNGTGGDPKVVATFLLLRSASMLQATILLAERGMEVEARTMVRSLIENALCLGALDSNPAKFMDMLKADTEAARKGQASFILANKLVATGSTHEQHLTELIDTLEKGVRNLSIKDVAELSPLKTLYLQYRVISNDSAHPSATALAKYMNTLPDRSAWKGYLVGPASEAAIDDCLLMLVQAATALGVAYTQIVGDTAGNHAIAELCERFRPLSQATYGREKRAEATP